MLVGDDAPSRRYVASKRKKAAEAGMVSDHHELPAIEQRTLQIDHVQVGAAIAATCSPIQRTSGQGPSAW